MKAEHCAVAETSGTTVGIVVPRFGRSDAVAFVGTTRTIFEKIFYRNELVQTVALDDFWRDQGRPHVRLLKIDAEGTELPVLRGCTQILRAKQCDYLVIETELRAQRYNGAPWDTVKLLREYGYSHLYRFIDQAPFLVRLGALEQDMPELYICAACEPIDFVNSLALCQLRVEIKEKALPPKHSRYNMKNFS